MKIEESIRTDTAREENRYYHDSHIAKIYTIMIRLGGELILSRFALRENRYYHDSPRW
jgi:hypothetical protein